MMGKKLRKIMQRLLLMFCMLKKKKIYPAYVSKHNSNREKLSYSFNHSKQRKMALSCSKKIIRGIMFKSYGDFYCLNCLHSFRTKNFNHINKFVKIKIFVTWQCFLKTLKYQNLINIKNWIKHHLLC